MTLEQLIAKHEGKEPNIYYDSLGIPTIGIGHNIKASPLPEGFNPPLSDDQIDQLFQIDLNNALTPLKLNLPWFSNLDEVRQAVLIDMSFNVGWHSLSQFKHTLSLIENGQYTDAAANMLASLWAKQVGIRAKEDAEMMETGLWPDDPGFNLVC